MSKAGEKILRGARQALEYVETCDDGASLLEALVWILADGNVVEATRRARLVLVNAKRADERQAELQEALESIEEQGGDE